MKLIKLTISNFRSIELETFTFDADTVDQTYTLIGINEAGKSSFLRAISLVVTDDTLPAIDFFDDKKPVKVDLRYALNQDEEKQLIQLLLEKGLDKASLSQIKVTDIEIGAVFDAPGSTKKAYEKVSFNQNTLPNYSLVENVISQRVTESDSPLLDLPNYFESQLPDYFRNIMNKITFWKSDNQFLINDQIDLESFTANPTATSLPLLNCFNLAGIQDIPAEVTKIKDNPAEINNLQEKLDDKVTAHIKKIWPSHPIKIKFQINNMHLSFLVEDSGVKYSAKTTQQRSDGFKQFISFLLTISAESANNQLSNSLLLLDEPETHLHPQAQELLLDELIKITKTGNNLVIFATHSNHMIDKTNLRRCFRVLKEGNKKTKLKRIERSDSTYSEVNYEVFDIPSPDYHNELYGYLEENKKTELDAIPKTMKWINSKSKKDEDVSLCTYIRHSIHHPENKTNKIVAKEQLVESIKLMRSIKYTI